VGARFCSVCGTPVDADQSAGEERKLVTVLFADVTGSTKLGERLDPEQLRDLMTSFFDAMRREIEAEGGTVEKFIGDAVMAAFGVPAAHEDDPARALRAALRMRDRLQELNARLRQRYGVSLEMRVGVNTGEVLAATAPRPGEAMVAGDAVNVAARLEQTARPGQILVGDRTARAARGFRLSESGSLALKGKSATTTAFELIEETIGHRRGVPGLAAPMVGRDQELAVIETLYGRVHSEGKPHLVTVYGDAGVGKSRLTAEFLGRVDDHDPAPMTLRGRCLPYGEGITYWPLAEILKSCAGVLDTDPPDLTLEKVQKLGEELFTEDLAADPARATAALAYTVGVEDPVISFRELSPRAVRFETHAAWRSFFSALSARQPLVIVIEDIHWADPAMLDMLEDLADRAEGPVLLICPSRPELTARRPGWGGGRRNFSSISLEPLTTADADRLIALLLAVEELPPSVHDRILERAEGNPFYLEEIIRQLIDAGQIVRAGARWRAVAEIEDVAIPDTVQAVLAARIDLLPPEDKRSVQLASVIGRVFWTGPLQRLLEAEPDHVEDALDRLEDRGLVTARMASTIAGQREFIFKHVLTRDVAYESLPRRDRAGAHVTVARWIEETAGDRWLEFVELIAFHYATGYEQLRARGDDESDEELRRKAFDYLVSASTDARSKLASSKAMALGEQSITIADGPLERARALEAVGNAAQDQYLGSEAWRCFSRAVEERLAMKSDEPEARHALARTCARACEIPTRWPGSMRTVPEETEVRRFLDLGFDVVPEGDNETRARLMVAQAFWPWAYPATSQSEEQLRFAQERGEQAVAMAFRLDRPDLASGALDGVSSALMPQGRYGDCLDIIDRRLALVDRIRDPLEIGDIHSLAAWIRVYVGLYRDGVAYAQRGFELTRGQMPSVALHNQAWKAMCLFRLGRWREFLVDFELLGELLGERRTDPPYFASRPFGAAAFIHVARGDDVAADRVLAVIDGLRGPQGWRLNTAFLLGSLAYAERGQLDRAREYMGEVARAAMSESGPVVWEAECDLVAVEQDWDRVPTILEEARAAAEIGRLMALPAFADRLEGRWHLAGDRVDRASELLQRAREGFDRIEARWETARTDMDLARALRAMDQPERARPVLDGAAAVFEELSAHRQLAEAQQLLSDIG
jgi:class 3 adenylate cyclase/tetratricopeptide (TPR) repeat protein